MTNRGIERSPRHQVGGAARHTGSRLATAVLLALVLPALAAAGPTPELRVYAHKLSHQPAHEALALVRPFLSPWGTVEEQPGANTLVIRDLAQNIDRIAPALDAFDHPPENLRFEIQLVRAGPQRQVISPLAEAPADRLPEAQVERLKRLLRYEDYQVLARAAVSSKEREEVTYALGDGYRLTFRPGTVLAGQRLKLEGFRVSKQVKSAAKGRQLEPRDLFNATLNLWLERPFNLVLAQDESRQEALMVVISCRREPSRP